ncbi:MAG: hypothetical protein CMJ18_08135 [Phycisphaeraceae bacterium]|nr:hypothetical protein [Phycisphaeraceae bacterium]
MRLRTRQYDGVGAASRMICLITVLVVMHVVHASALAGGVVDEIVIQWSPRHGTGYDWNAIRKLTTDDYRPDNVMRVSVEYLAEAIERMTGRRPTIRSSDDLSRGIVLTTIAGAPRSIRNDPRVRAALARADHDLYNATEAFYIRSERKRVVLVANNEDGLSNAIVELLESVGYEVLGMGRNWIHAPDYRKRRLRFRIRRAGRPSFYIRGLNPMSAQATGRGTIAVTPPDPRDESVIRSTMRWKTGFRLWGKSCPLYPGHALDSYHDDLVRVIKTTGKTEGFLAPDVRLGDDADRPPASTDNDGVLWINREADAETGEDLAYLSNGSTWRRMNLRNTAGPSLDLSVPAARGVVLDVLRRRAADHFRQHPDRLFVFGTDPEDGGGYGVLTRYLSDPDWYPKYLAQEKLPFGAPYRLHGHFGLDQPRERWVPDLVTNHVFGFNNWLLREYDKWIDSLPEPERRTATGKSKKQWICLSLFSYNHHDVPPTFNLDRRIRVMIAGYPKNRGRGQWLQLANQRQMARAFKILVPAQPSADYRIISLGDYWDQTLDGILPRWSASPRSLHRDLRSTYDAGLKAIYFEIDYNFGKNGLGYYLLSKLLWNIDLTVEETRALRDRWLQRSFGSAWKQMKAYYDFMLLENLRTNGPSTWSRAIRLIDEADRVLDGAREPDARRRLDDFKQFWYFYYLVDTGKAAERAPEMQEFIWKGQMSYITSMEMVIDFFKVPSRNPADAAGDHAKGRAHYTHEETRRWWKKVLDHWPVQETASFADALLADGARGSTVDLHDLVRVRQFRADRDDERNVRDGLVFGRRPVTFYTATSEVRPRLGFSLAWPWVRADRDGQERAIFYGAERWDDGAERWVSFVDQTTTFVASQAVRENDGRSWQRARVLRDAAIPGTYRVQFGAGGSDARLEAMTTEQGGAMPMTFPFTRNPVAGNPRVVAYIPRNTSLLDLEIRHRSGVRITLFDGLPGKGRKTRTVILDRPGLHRIELSPGEDGTVARMTQETGATLYIPYFHSIPNYWAMSPEALLVPRAVAAADRLTIMD